MVNEKTICEDWFDYANGCYDTTCDGTTTKSLHSEASSWLATQGYTTLTSTTMCTVSAPWPIDDTSGNNIYVANVCQQICDTCPTSTSKSSTTSTTTENRRKYLQYQNVSLVFFDQSN